MKQSNCLSIHRILQNGDNILIYGPILKKKSLFYSVLIGIISLHILSDHLFLVFFVNVYVGFFLSVRKFN